MDGTLAAWAIFWARSASIKLRSRKGVETGLEPSSWSLSIVAKTLSAEGPTGTTFFVDDSGPFCNWLEIFLNYFHNLKRFAYDYCSVKQNSLWLLNLSLGKFYFWTSSDENCFWTRACFTVLGIMDMKVICEKIFTLFNKCLHQTFATDHMYFY